MSRMDDIVCEWKKKASTFKLPAILTTKFFGSRLDVPSSEVDIGPTFPAVSDVIHQVPGVPESIQDLEGHVHTAIKNTEKAVNDALVDLRALQNVTKRHLNDYQNGPDKFDLLGFMGNKLRVAERKAKESHQNAQKQLAHLRALLDSAKLNVSEQEKELMRAAIARYGDLAYDLSGLVTEIRRLQNQSSALMNLTRADYEDKAKLHDEINSILPKSISRKPFLKDDGSEMTIEEMNSLLAMSLERLDKLQENLQASGAAAKRHIAMALQKYKNEADIITQEAVERAISHEQIKRELERFEWEKQARANTEHELNAALARHGHHLAYMLRLKQDEMEHQFDHRLREALAEQKMTIEGEIHRWTRRMEAIEHVVDGRANIDRIAKETQALWLAVEALAFALEMPFSKIGSSGTLGRQTGEFKPFYMSEPLGSYVDAVKGTAGEGHEFANVIVESLPREALTDGVWTRQGLLQRFNQVYKTACNVALVGETGGSLWSYAMSWLQARLLFDGLGRQRVLARLPGVGPTLLTPESEWPAEAEGDAVPDAFCLLTSARAALMPETDTAVNVDPTNCADIEFAVRLLSQLRGQPAAVAADWIHDARRFLEVHQAIQALLAYATAQNFSAFEERL
ncbi:Mitochondrial inner membrane protein [Echinococcus multilocularis]|uniref:MICOS complex subunit MIC60 n=1 Tax=Echinococcus multilocularis TaxID=6211 RepID=A0A068Y803_ECHMU|nr:Mitochondrial inner membrane protein [Echinococcus multilocularis]